MDDTTLLREYVEHGSEAAFAALVERHVNRVYSVAFRHTGNPLQAGEITQTVFILLARKAPQLRRGVLLYAWLYKTARLTSVALIRGEIRRTRREQEAFVQNSANQNPEPEVWPQVAPLLDTALSALNETDRRALVLRFFYGKSMREIGADLGANEAAAKKRIGRALDKLQHFFRKRGIPSTTAALENALVANAVLVAPATLAHTATALALAKGATASTSTLTLINGALKIMAWTKIKTAIIVGAGVLLAAGTTTLTITAIQHAWTYPWQVFDSKDVDAIMKQTPPQARIVATKFPHGSTKACGTGAWSWTAIRADGKAMGMNCTVDEIIRYAYSTDSDFVSKERVLLETNSTNQCYDFIVNLTSGAKDALQLEVRKKLGLVAKFEPRTVAALALKASTNQQGLKAGSLLNGVVNLGEGESGLSHITSMSGLAKRLDGWVRLPVVDQTGLNNHFDLTLRWTTTSGSSGDALKPILLDQLGLELVPSQEPVEMLVVKKAP